MRRLDGADRKTERPARLTAPAALGLKAALVGAAFTALAAGPAGAEEAAGKWSGFIGGGGFVTPDYEGSDDYQALPFAAARLAYDGYYLQTRGLGVRANIVASDAIDFGPALSYKGARDDDVESAAVSRMAEVDAAVEAGLFVRVPVRDVMMPRDELSVDLQADTGVGDGHDGSVVAFGLGYDFAAAPDLRLGLSVSASYADADYSDAYFSVDAADSARSGLSGYDADAGFKDVGVGASARYRLSGAWGLTGFADYTRLIGDAADSPVVDVEGSPDQFRAGVGVSYSFGMRR
ncbi:MAG: MipA/OmpV family protein [Marivibrio sp.]|uniref:MipA/OmpV family protein n=1 Tax=Marivibrio sp. TaxID=2039719 RepID=UPI0032EBA445